YDSTAQPALFSAPPPGRGPAPLLVVLHTWSGDYLQQESLPYYRLAEQRGWVFVHPDFRGPNHGPAAAGSPAATADILDAVAYARARTSVDEARIYLTGTSGGGHMTLLTAARHPEIWAAASAWVPISHLALWYGECYERGNLKYMKDMEASCGGAPVDDGPEVDACYRLRSPLSVLHQAAGLPLEICAGIRDGHEGSVPVSQTLLAFNVLAEANGMPEKALSPGQIHYFVTTAQVPASLRGEAVDDPSYGPKKVLFRRSAGPARVTIFDGAHEGIPEAAVAWLETHRKK
ncbi:MAG: prolyl oligopeptidase family serine peptidase, partial [Candidatus Glassbacteria bacterium]|nr:prolyl oligopeptidase family serine peptidase [Candidatus Glassbacteria bacterium]